MRVLLLLVSCAYLSLIWCQTCPRCTPLCQNGDGTAKLCGNDGCGGSCGTCASGQACCRGVCVCQPNCVGRVCGDDGCGGQACGQCSSSQTCVNGVCSGVATPTCAGRVCGSDRAGGSCGSCPAGQRCRAGQCECYYDCNERNCGNAAQDPGANTALCPSRPCGTCPNGFTCGSNGLCSAQTPCAVTIRVLDCSTNIPITVSSTVLITSTTLSYSTSLTIAASSSGSWTTPGTGTFSFQVTASGYSSKTDSRSVTSTTTSIDLCVNRPNIPITVVDCTTNAALSTTSTVSITATSLSYSTSVTVSAGGSAMWTLPGSGSFTFSTSASGYSSKTETRTVTESTSSIQICLGRSSIVVRVLDCSTNIPVTVSSSVTITTTSYSTSLTVGASSSASWTAPSFGSFTFMSSASGYVTKSEVRTVSDTTTNIDLCLNRPNIPITVVDCTTNAALAMTSTVSITATFMSYSTSVTVSAGGSAMWTLPGSGSFTFSTSASGYSIKTETRTVTESTSSIQICLSVATQIDVRNRATDKSITVTTSVTWTGQGSGSLTWTAITGWAATGGFGTYSFVATPSSTYAVGTATITVTASTTLIVIYVDVLAFCGDQICSNGESYDCRSCVNCVNCKTCAQDCSLVIFQMEDATKSQSVVGFRVNMFTDDPRDWSNLAYGPTRKQSVPIIYNFTAAINSYSLSIYTLGYNQTFWFEVLAEDNTGRSYIPFYWKINTKTYHDAQIGQYPYVRAHLTPPLNSSTSNVGSNFYRLVCTWLPDSTAGYHAPKSLSPILFFPWNNSALETFDNDHRDAYDQSSNHIGTQVLNNPQSGGPATFDFYWESPSSSQPISIWTVKNPRSPILSSSQQNPLNESYAYITLYGSSPSRRDGVQLNVIALSDTTTMNNYAGIDLTKYDAWYVSTLNISPYSGSTFSYSYPLDQDILQLSKADPAGSQDRFIDCLAYPWCNNFRIPYQDSRRAQDGELLEE